MDPFLEKWLTNVFSKSGRQIVEPFRVVGVRDQHMGPTWQKAEIEVHVASSDAFAAEIADAKLLSMDARDISNGLFLACSTCSCHRTSWISTARVFACVC